MSLKGTSYYAMAKDAGAADGDEAEQMAQMIQTNQRECEMSDWLDEIEISIKGKLSFGKLLVDIQRMARVIREQSAYIKASLAVEEACLKFEPVDIAKLNNDRLNAWDNLSPDAKELVEFMVKESGDENKNR